jgi:hypothetical protein
MFTKNVTSHLVFHFRPVIFPKTPSFSLKLFHGAQRRLCRAQSLILGPEFMSLFWDAKVFVERTSYSYEYIYFLRLRLGVLQVATCIS